MAIAVADEARRSVSGGFKAFKRGRSVIDDDTGELRLIEAVAASRGGRHEVEHLTRSEEAFLEGAVVDGLHRGTALDGEAGRGGGGLAEYHEDGLHADGAVGDVAGAHADGHEEVGAFCGLGTEATVADRVGPATDLDIALVADESFLGHEALDVVRVHLIGAHANGVFDDFDAAAVLLGHHVVGDHAAGFADVELARPVAVIEELVLG